MIQIKEKTMEFEQNERICNEVQELKISMERRMNVCDIEVEELRWEVVPNHYDSYCIQLAQNNNLLIRF